MGELALRSARDQAMAGILRRTNDAWYKTLRGLLRRAAREGHLQPDLDTDDVAALIVAALTSMMLPTVSSADRIDQTFRQLERMLGVSGRTGQA
jgi:citrate lyase beta subunit